MRNLVRRYITVTQKKTESQVITEDDVNEIKQDISSFRCEMMEILKNSGMTIANPSSGGEVAAITQQQKRKPKMKKLVKGFSVATGFLDAQLESRSYEKMGEFNLVDSVMFAPGLTPRKTMFPNHGRSKQ